ncbi:MAG: AAA family ATPase [Cryomorphaceae bacterium]|nr:MoxR family ATPase [Flavobacteriales bacterium]
MSIEENEGAEAPRENDPKSPEPTQNQEVEQPTPPAENADSLGLDKTDALHSEAADVRSRIQEIKQEIGKIIIGQDELIELMITAMITNGHVLIEGVPGIAKTLTSKLLARTLSVDFTRIQFTPDLMPTDIVGTTIFDMKRSEFYFKQGPVFSNVILIDEINRAPAKTQAALMEVMEEEQVTVDGKTYPMDAPFFVIATQNPVEQEGTYKLPEAQLDRFMFKLIVDYPSQSEEEAMLFRFREDFYGRQEREINALINAADLKKYRELVEKVFIKDELLKYIAAIVSLTRNNSDLYLGASPRASLNILKASKGLALLAGRGFVTPDDIKRATYPVLNHRLILSYEREIEGIEIREIIESLVRKVEVPR